MAARRNRECINAGRVRLHCVDVADYCAAEPNYTKVIAANVVYFWEDPLSGEGCYCLVART